MKFKFKRSHGLKGFVHIGFLKAKNPCPVLQVPENVVDFFMILEQYRNKCRNIK